MALKICQLSPHFHHISSLSFSSNSQYRFSKHNAVKIVGSSSQAPTFLVIGHRGNGMNVLHSNDSRMNAFKENTILSFNAASNHPIDFVELDVQVTKDGCPIIFHDDFIFSAEQNGAIYEKRVQELSLLEFLSYGPQKEPGLEGKRSLRKAKNGEIDDWEVESDDCLCTLQEAFQKVKPYIGFNIELKFDDYAVYRQEYLKSKLEAVLRVVYDYAKERLIMFSTFQPDGALLLKKLQNTYPVFFLTDGGIETHKDMRRNSLEEAIKLCLEGGLEGIVSEVRGVFKNPGAVNKMKESKLSLLTYGKLNNVVEAVYMQHLMGVDGVIVDFVKEISEGVGKMMKPYGGQEVMLAEVEGNMPQFSPRELEFMLKLISELIIQQQ